jgi:hypothetical protein
MSVIEPFEKEIFQMRKAGLIKELSMVTRILGFR